MSERDTHFAGFAKALVDEMFDRDIVPCLSDVTHFWAWKNERKIVEQLIAQRVYDLACHVATHTQLTAHGDMSKIPDLTKLPEEG